MTLYWRKLHNRKHHLNWIKDS